MSQEIAVVGSPDFTTGFRLAGVGRFANIEDEDKSEELDGAMESLLADDDVGIIVMHQDDMEHLSRGIREDVETSVEPAVVTLGGGAGSGGLRDQIKRAIGIDLMEDN